MLRRGTRELGREHVDLSDRDSFRYAWRALREAADADAARLTPAGGVRDSPMRWATHDIAASLVEEAMHDMIPGDATPLATRYPRRWFYAREQRRWFLPAGMRGVRWDRAPGDVFASHPAWTASRIAVRERAAPAAKEDGWSTFLFARRPVATDFGEVLETYGAGVRR